MDIYLFRDLARLNNTGNFSQAADQSNLSQSAFSRRIRSLESWIGVTLVDRSRQPVRLTTAGLQILEAGQQALERIEQERSQILEAQSLPDKYVVTFGAQHSIGWRFYPTWLQGFEETYGPILSRLRADDLPNCLRDLRNGDVDFVIAYESHHVRYSEQGTGPPESHPDKSGSLVIGYDSLIPVSKPQSDGNPLFSFSADKIEMPFLRFGEDAPIARHLEPLFKGAGLSARLRIVYENSMAGALRIRARDGMGVAWLPKSLVAPDMKAGILVQTGAPEWEVPLEIRLFRHKPNSNRVTRSIWSFLESQQSQPLKPGA
ncbi:LysR family transcriptional regulator [Roseibium album]|uniref:LysR family transcriptional regulator n=1 Tax=Roseibium album TaxID=311410 RepID=UPI0024935D87|nr:LysR family transcriptional regulator [Roseibium album]